MNTIRVFKGNELLYTFQSSIVPPKGSYLWIDESVLYYEVTDLSYNLKTGPGKKHMNIDVHVK